MLLDRWFKCCPNEPLKKNIVRRQKQTRIKTKRAKTESNKSCRKLPKTDVKKSRQNCSKSATKTSGSRLMENIFKENCQNKNGQK
jgi:hypothetical protein